MSENTPVQADEAAPAPGAAEPSFVNDPVLSADPPQAAPQQSPAAATPQPAPAPADMQTRSSTLTESLYQAIRAGNMPKDNPALKKLVEAFDEKPADQARMKQAQEELETAIAMSARDIVAKGQNDKATFDELLRLYESQPSLNIRTSTSVANQAPSKPPNVAARMAPNRRAEGNRTRWAYCHAAQAVPHMDAALLVPSSCTWPCAIMAQPSA